MITAWSTPGAALLTSALADYPYAEAIGAFVVAGVLMAVVGATGLFGRILDRIPPAIVAATLAGILFPFALAAFAALSAAPEIVAPVLVAFVLAKRILARYAVLLALLAGVAAASVTGQLDFSGVRLAVAKPLLEVPAWSLSAIVGLALPLFIVTLGSQQAPGMGVLRAAGYKTNDRLLIGSTGLVSTLPGAVRVARDQSCRHHGRDLHGRRGASRPAAPLRGRTRLRSALWHIGAAFWGLVFGVVAHAILSWRPPGSADKRS